MVVVEATGVASVATCPVCVRYIGCPLLRLAWIWGRFCRYMAVAGW